MPARNLVIDTTEEERQEDYSTFEAILNQLLRKINFIKNKSDLDCEYVQMSDADSGEISHETQIFSGSGKTFKEIILESIDVGQIGKFIIDSIEQRLCIVVQNPKGKSPNGSAKRRCVSQSKLLIPIDTMAMGFN